MSVMWFYIVLSIYMPITKIPNTVLHNLSGEIKDFEMSNEMLHMFDELNIQHFLNMSDCNKIGKLSDCLIE